MSQPGQDVPDEMVTLVADLFGRWYGQDLDFTDEARTLLATVLPAHEAMVKARFADDIDAACPCQPDRPAAFTCPVHGWAAQRLRANLGQILLDLAARWRDRNDATYASAAEEMLDQFGDAFLAAAQGTS